MDLGVEGYVQWLGIALKKSHVSWLNPHFLPCQDYGKANLFRARSILPTLNERPPERNERPPLSDLQVRPWDVDPGGCFEVCGWKKSTSC